MAGPREPDIALLRVRGPAVQAVLDADGNNPLGFGEVVSCAAPSATGNQQIGVVGYPSVPSMASQADLAIYFNGIFHVKRFGFGWTQHVEKEASFFTHDATTLPGSSGSLVFDMETGNVIGLHYGGQDYAANYAVPGDLVKAVVDSLDARIVQVPALPVLTEAASRPGRFRGRDGYDPDFLGTPVLPPGPGLHPLAQAVSDDDGGKVTELKYRHFSVWMHADRLLPVITAVNIDGMRSKKTGRTDQWLTDHRLPASAQVDNAGYKNNPLDRGHMVRREDPVWGELAEAEEANLDTFFYTNAAPQHEDLNQKDWLALEDYILGAARARGLRVSVFTGPVFREDDPLYRDLVKIPRAFWKIAALIDDDTGQLSVTGYLLSQAELIHDMVKEFAFGAFRTYQLRVADIGAIAGLDVAHLAAFDPLDATLRHEGAETAFLRVVTSAANIALLPPGRPGSAEAVSADALTAAEVEEALSTRESDEVDGMQEARPEATTAPAQWQDAISDRGYALCVKWETGGRGYYDGVIRGRPVWPGYASGITIGCGYDLGYHSPAQIRADWSGRIGGAALDRLLAVSGFRTVAPDRDAKVTKAKKLVAALSDIVVPWDTAIAQFDQSKMPRLVTDLYRALDNLDRLHPHCRGALLSLVFNRGHGGFTLPDDRYRELRAIRAAMAKGTAAAFASIPAELRGMKRIWGTGSSLSTRREEEARLFEAGLAEMALTEAVASPVTEATDPMTERHDPLSEGTDPSYEEALVRTTVLEAPSYSLSDVGWLQNDSEHPDYRHLPGRNTNVPFRLTALHLERLLIWNHFTPKPGLLVFALRGAKITAGDKAENVDEVELTETRPDHRDFRCVMGVLNRTTGRIWAYRASTVPNASAVLGCYQRSQAGMDLVGNMLPTGCYTYTVGTHKRNHPTREIRGVLRLSSTADGASEVVVLRSLSDVRYDRYDFWHRCAPADNIHPGRLSSGFSSEGCLTLPGNYVMSSRTHTGLWAAFRTALGLGTVSDSGENGQQFSVMLVTGRDAALAVETLEGGAAAMRRLRFGSQGPAVAALQSWLGLAPDAQRKIGPATMKALTDRQQTKLGWADGIWSAATANLIGGPADL